MALFGKAQRHFGVEGPCVPLGCDRELQQSSLVGKSVWVWMACVTGGKGCMRDGEEKEECHCPWTAVTLSQWAHMFQYMPMVSKAVSEIHPEEFAKISI